MDSRRACLELTRALSIAVVVATSIAINSACSRQVLGPDAEIVPQVVDRAAEIRELEPGGHPGDEWIDALGMIFCWCPAGAGGDGFWIGKYELTVREFGQTVESGLAKEEYHPRDMVRPRDVREFLRQRNATERAAGRLPRDWEYALPTEAEWEHAARAGTSTPYYFGADRSQLIRHANFADRSLLGWAYTEKTLDDGARHLARVGTYAANPWGIHDLYGNLAEWVESSDEGIVRGGSWASAIEECNSSKRRVIDPEQPRSFLGFRIVLRRVR